jgi:N-acetylglucosaminyldiphosphoundecaprenol N-acetyl-beta-D-mannosaminyltransferase
MKKISLLNIPLNFYSKEEILENNQKLHLKKNIYQQIISINPENLVTATKNKEFKDVVVSSQIHIADGVGIIAAARFLYNLSLPRCTGVDLMKDLCEMAYKDSLSVVLIGGRPNLAKELAKCQNQIHASTNFYGLEGYKDKLHPTELEEKQIDSIVAVRKPSLVFVAFGSPYQEIWIDRHKDLFSRSVCMGVGGSFDFLTGTIKRAPAFIQNSGLEWLYRLFKQPWRWRRQLSLIEFAWKILKEKVLNK